MAAPREAIEEEVNVRRFLGVNTQIDPVFVGGQFLRISQNLFPQTTYRLSKRPGSPLLCKSNVTGTTNITDLLYLSSAGHRYLFAYYQNTTNDFMGVFVDDSPLMIGLATPALLASEAVGRFIYYGDDVYMGNGIDPIHQITLPPAGSPVGTPPTVVALAPITDLDDSTATVAQNAIPANAPASIIPGAYAFAWAVYNKDTKLYESRTAKPGHSITLNAGFFLHFTAPTPTLPANKGYRLFVAVQNAPVEFACLQGDTLGGGGQAIDVTAVDVNQNFVPQETNVLRTGNFFTLFLSRLVFGGNATDPHAAFATGVLLPGYESTTFNTGAFFPAFARIPMPEDVTAVGIASVTSGFDPQAPLVVHTPIRTTLYTGGDPFDPNGTASRVELSARIGNPAPKSIVSTPFGYFFISLDSVYMIPPGGGYPQDVGWPIADVIRSIPTGRRPFATACFHKGFLKLAFSRPGEGVNATQYWLDLRLGLTATPSWWGPMVGLPISAFAVAVDHPAEWDRGFAAIEETDEIVLTHQLGPFADLYDPAHPTTTGTPIESIFRTGTFDDDKPFIEKIFTRFRCIAHADHLATCNVTVITDSGHTWPIDPMIVTASGVSEWNHLVDQGLARWNHLVDQTALGGAAWTSFMLVEAQTLSPLVRPRGLSCEVVVRHTDPSDIQFRDFALLYLPVDRKVRAGNPPTGS